MYPDTVAVSRKPRFYYGWLIVLTGFLGDFMTAGVAVHSFGFILKPMTQELGWTRAMTMGAASMRTVTGAFSGVIIGPLLDRYGARPIMVLGAIIGGIGIIALSRVNEIWQFYLVYGLMGAVGMIAMGGLVSSAVVTKWFIRKRGRAMAIVAAGLPLGGAALGPVTQIIIENFGWRTAWLVLGSLILLVIIPAAGIFMRRTPEDIGLLPDGDNAPLKPNPGEVVKPEIIKRVAARLEETWTLKEALRTPVLWMIIASFILSGMGLSAGIFHQTAYISDKGLSSAVLTTNIIVFGFSAALGSLFWGFLSERIQVRYCVAASFLVSAGGLVLLIIAQDSGAVILYAIAYGVGAGGSAPLNAIILANYFGRTFMGTIQGVVMPLRLIATAGGPLFAGYIFDITGSYDTAFTIFAATYLLGGLMIWVARRPVRKEAML